MKKKILLTSIMTIVMCASLIVGATMALFTSESKVNIAITSGKVSVEASVKSLTTYSKDVLQASGTFENGGTATQNGAEVTLEKMTPMDKAVLEIDVTSETNVAYQQRIKLSASGDAELYGQLLIGYSTDGTNYTYYGSLVTAWEGKSAVSAATTETVYVLIELPEYAGNSAQDKSCAVTLAVEAVQGNAVTTDESAASQIHFVTETDKVSETVAAMENGETLVLGGSAATWENASVAIEYSDAKTIYVRGYKIGTLSINAPQGTVYLYNDVGTLGPVIVAGDSLHVYGNVGTVQVTNGHVVVEAGAAVEALRVAATEDAAVTITVQAGATIAKLIAESGSATLVNNGTITDIDVQENADLINKNIPDAQSLRQALSGGGQIYLTADIVTDQVLYVPEGKTVTLYLQGYDIQGTNAGFLIENHGTMTIIGDETSCVYTTEVSAQGRHALVNYGTMTVKGGVYGDKNTDRTDANDVQRGNAVRNFGTMVIEDGIFTCCDNYVNGGYAYAIANGDTDTPDAVLTIQNATVYGNMNGVLAADGGKLIVNGGTYTLGNGEASTCYRMAYTSDYGVIEINDGTFTRNVDNNYAFFGAFYAHSEEYQSIIINGGTFTDSIQGTIKVDGSGKADDPYGGYYGGLVVINSGNFSGAIQGTNVSDNRNK